MLAEFPSSQHPAWIRAHCSWAPQMVHGHAGWYQVYSKAWGNPQVGVTAHVAREPACLLELSLLIPRCLCIAFKMRFHEVGRPLVARASFNTGCQAAPALSALSAAGSPKLKALCRQSICLTRGNPIAWDND